VELVEVVWNKQKRVTSLVLLGDAAIRFAGVRLGTYARERWVRRTDASVALKLKAGAEAAGWPTVVEDAAEADRLGFDAPNWKVGRAGFAASLPEEKLKVGALAVAPAAELAGVLGVAVDVEVGAAADTPGRLGVVEVLEERAGLAAPNLNVGVL